MPRSPRPAHRRADLGVVGRLEDQAVAHPPARADGVDRRGDLLRARLPRSPGTGPARWPAEPTGVRPPSPPSRRRGSAPGASTTTSTSRVRRERRSWVCCRSSSRTAVSTARTARGLTPGRPWSTRSTVAGDSAACSAMSRTRWLRRPIAPSSRAGRRDAIRAEVFLRRFGLARPPLPASGWTPDRTHAPRPTTEETDMTSTTAHRTADGFRRREDCRLEDLLAVLAEPTDVDAYPHADRVEQGVLVYEAESVRAAPRRRCRGRRPAGRARRRPRRRAGHRRPRRCLRPRRSSTGSPASSSASSPTRRPPGGTAGDHFAKPGANDRVWNALEKARRRRPRGLRRVLRQRPAGPRGDGLARPRLPGHEPGQRRQPRRRRPDGAPRLPPRLPVAGGHRPLPGPGPRRLASC